MERIAEQVRQFVAEQLTYDPDHSFDDTTPLEDVIDSMKVLELITFLESSYSISIKDEEVVTENLGSIRSIATFVARKLNSPAADLQSEIA